MRAIEYQEAFDTLREAEAALAELAAHPEYLCGCVLPRWGGRTRHIVQATFTWEFPGTPVPPGFREVDLPRALVQRLRQGPCGDRCRCGSGSRRVRA